MKKPLYKDESGVAQVVIVLIVLVVIAAAGFAGWRVMQNNKAPAAAKTTAGKAVNSACLKIYNDKNICYAATASADFEKVPYTAVDTSTDAQGQATKLTLQSDGKGNNSMTTTGGGQEFSTITIGTTVYTKISGSDSWTKYTSGSAAPATTNPSGDLKTQFSDAATPAGKRIQYKSLGTEKCGNQNCYKYQVTDPALAGSTNYVWFSTKDYRLQRWYGKDANSTNDFVITYGPVKITAPSPVTDAASGAPGGVPTQAEIQAAEQQAQAAAAQAGQ